MWRAYSLRFIRGNRASTRTVTAAALAAALLLSLLVNLLYSVWAYETARIAASGGLTEDPDSALVLLLFGAVAAFACLALVLIIHSAFAVFLGDRVRQFGILSSIGATPRQLRSCMLQEALILCAPPILLGNLVGMAAAAGLLEWINVFLREAAPDRMDSHFSFHPLVLAASLLCAAATVWAAAWLPARRLSRLTPLQAIRGAEELQPKRKLHTPILDRLFGVEGLLAGSALHARRKVLRAASLSMALSFLAFTLMASFFSLSRLSTQITYWDRYQNAWDVMITVQDAEIATFSRGEVLLTLPGVRDVLAYQRAEARRLVTAQQLSEPFAAAGAFARASAEEAEPASEGWLVSAPILILDDAAFLSYCEQVGAPPRLDGVIVYNEVRDDTDPNFRERHYLPYLREDQPSTTLLPAGSIDAGEALELPVLHYAHQTPILREQFGVDRTYEMAHFMPASLWAGLAGTLDGGEAALTVRILAAEGVDLAALDALEAEARALLAGCEIESENRVRAQLESDRAYDALMILFGGFCVLLAVFGLSGVFLNTMGFVRQRRRELARYLSVGMDPAQVRKMFCIEALVLAGRPVLISLPLAALLTALFLHASYLDAGLFLQNAPVLPVALFIFALFGGVGLAYYLGGRRLLRCSLTELLRDETMT